MKLYQLGIGYVVMAVFAVVINLGLLALAVWLVVKILQWMGVL